MYKSFELHTCFISYHFLLGSKTLHSPLFELGVSPIVIVPSGITHTIFEGAITFTFNCSAKLIAVVAPSAPVSQDINLIFPP